MSDAPTLASTTAVPSAPPAGNPPAPAPPPAAPVKPTPGSKEWAQLTPEQRHTQLRGPPNPRAQGHSPARDTYEQIRHAQDQAPGEAPPPPAADQQQPTTAPGEKFKVGRYEIDERSLSEMLSRQAQDDLRAATRPASAEAYKAELPEGLKLPGGQTYTFNQNDPSLVAARNLAHAKGWSQQDFSEALGIFASHIAGQEAALSERSAAEVAKAGVNAPQRVDAVGRWITAEVGEADAKPIRATIVTDAHLRFYERLMNKISSQGTASFSTQHRVPPDDAKIPGYENMSFEQRRFAQDQVAARTRR